MSTPGANLPEEPQKERGAKGSRDSGPHGSAGGTDRPSGPYEGDESVPSYGQPGEGGFDMSGELPPQPTEPVLPPYEGRKTSASEGTSAAGVSGGARTAGATGPTTDPDYKSPAPGATPGGATASPAEEQPASQMPESDRDYDAPGPAHTAGTGRGEQKR